MHWGEWPAVALLLALRKQQGAAWVSRPWLCVECALSTGSPYACVIVCVCRTQAPMHVVSTTAAAAACASPYQEAGSAPVPKTKYWTLPTTPAAKVGGRMLRACVRACECLRSYFSEDQFGAIWVADLEREEFFFLLFARPHIFADLLKRNSQGQNLVLVLRLNLGLVWFRIRLCSGGEGWGLGEGLGNAFCQWMSSQK